MKLIPMYSYIPKIVSFPPNQIFCHATIHILYIIYIGKHGISFDFTALHYRGIVVLSTVVLTSLLAVDSLDKTRFRFIAGHLGISLRGTDKWGV